MAVCGVPAACLAAALLILELLSTLPLLQVGQVALKLLLLGSRCKLGLHACLEGDQSLLSAVQ